MGCRRRKKGGSLEDDRTFVDGNDLPPQLWVDGARHILYRGDRAKSMADL